ncbi:MAG TPA: polynucleotide adenylyltransferase PcnB, partial [Burkholderiaceae bacterium]
MIRKFIDRLLGKSTPAPDTPPLPEGVTLGQRVEIGVDQHAIDPRLINDQAVKVVRTLQDAGHEAYIVGGAVRDLLVGLEPKDFDVATNATPEQVKSLFRRAFIVGRRFRLVHVVYGRGREHEKIEVSTFRAYVDNAEAAPVPGNEKTSKDELAGKSHAVDASGRVLRDNVWGPQNEDAARRDITVNAMYYDPRTQVVVDYHGGMGDSKARVLRMIGDPEVRYREDPVRIIRVLRFAAKMGYRIDPRTEAPIRKMKSLLANVPSSRMFDEMIKLLQTGHALASMDVLRKHGLDRGVFPILDAHFEAVAGNPAREDFVNRALADTDRRVNEGKPVAPSFLLACMFWFDVSARWQQLREQGESPTPALQAAIDATFDARIGDISGRGKIAADMRDIWMMQPRFDKRSGSSPLSMLQQSRFRAAFDFMRLRADAGEVDEALVQWWEDFSTGDDERRRALLESARKAQPARREKAPA